MIPVATTTIAVMRVPVDPARDPEDAQPAAEVVATGVRAQISTSRGRELTEGASTQEIVDFRLSCDPVDLDRDDQVRDEVTGEVYEVTWARDRRGPASSLNHTQAGLRQVSGAVARSRMRSS